MTGLLRGALAACVPSAAALYCAAVPSHAQAGRPKITAVTGIVGNRDSHQAALLNAVAAEHVSLPNADARHAMIRASAHDSSDVDGSAAVNGDVAIAGSAVVSAKERLRSDTM